MTSVDVSNNTGLIKHLQFLLFSTILAYSCSICVAIPRRGNEPWSVILCKFADIPYEPKTREWFSEWMIGRNKLDTIERYFSDVSNNVYTITGSSIHGWFTLPWTLSDVKRLALEDQQLQESSERDFAVSFDYSANCDVINLDTLGIDCDSSSRLR
ncbi:unnamed protein product [Anisakis simplex]|uniref:Secreted protein n=1 Tax=Anisakis simplex TaxID=6269 RepID=A0A0M3K997_ANISI|nr:unnamed protein product [Anisakis simplex]